MPTFRQSKYIKDLFDRLAALEGTAGIGLPDVDNETIADLRAVTSYADTDRIFVLEKGAVYQFDDALTNADDGEVYIIPDDITRPDPGAWFQESKYSKVGHTHDDKVDKVTGVATDNIWVSNGSGGLKATGTKTADLVAKVAGKGLSTNDYTNEDKGKVANFPADFQDLLNAKLDKFEGVTGAQVGFFIVVNADGTISISDRSPASYDTTIVSFGPGDITNQVVTLNHGLGTEDIASLFIKKSDGHYVPAQNIAMSIIDANNISVGIWETITGTAKAYIKI